MPFETPTQFAILALVLLAGWLLGLASHSGGGKWKQRYHDEQEGHAAYRRGADANLAAANERIRVLEADRDRHVAAAPITATGPVTATGPISAAPNTAGYVAPTAPVTPAAMPTTGGTNRDDRVHFGHADDLSRIRGIDGTRAAALRDAGVVSLGDVENMSISTEHATEDRLNLARGTIAGEKWREQAALLRSGNEDEHRRRFG